MKLRLSACSLIFIILGSGFPGCIEMPCDFGGECDAAVEEPAEEDRWVGQPFPDFSLADADGRNWSNSEHEGEVWVAYFSASWCQHCETTFNAYDLAIPSGKFLAFNKDAREKYSNMSEWRDSTSERLGRNINRPFIHAPDLASELDIVGIPHAFFVDEEGVIVDYTYGVQGDSELLSQRFMDNGGIIP